MCFFSRKSRTASKPKSNTLSHLEIRFGYEVLKLLPKTSLSQTIKTLETWTDEAKSVTRSYFTEEARGHAILQRRRRLLGIECSLSKGEADGKPPSYFSSLSEDQHRKLQAEILNLTELYWASNRALASKRAEWPASNGALTTVKRAVDWKDQDGRPCAWAAKRNACAETGGCCGRDCGCCEKALLSYIRTSKENGDRKEVGVYGHCTEECPCCIRVRGRYRPDPRLPQCEF